MDGGNAGRHGRADRLFEAKFMLPWAFAEEAAAEKHMARLQHNMWVMATRAAVLSIVTRRQMSRDQGSCRSALPYRREEVLAVRSDQCPPALFNIETPRPRLEAIKVVDIASSNVWADLAATYLRTKEAHGEHELSKAELKKLMPKDAKEASGHGIKAKRSKSGAVIRLVGAVIEIVVHASVASLAGSKLLCVALQSKRIANAIAGLSLQRHHLLPDIDELGLFKSSPKRLQDSFRFNPAGCGDQKVARPRVVGRDKVDLPPPALQLLFALLGLPSGFGTAGAWLRLGRRDDARANESTCERESPVDKGHDQVLNGWIGPLLIVPAGLTPETLVTFRTTSRTSHRD
jgi:hypothetical protein